MKGSIRDRLERLEADVPKPPQPPSPGFLNMMAILDEIAHLRSSCASGLRGGVPIVPEDIPGKILGPGYTQRQLCELAVQRALEKRGVQRGVPKEEEARYVQALEVMTEERGDWDEPVGWEHRGEG